MKYINSRLKQGLFFICLLSTISCSDFLKEEVYTQYDPDVYLQTEEGINSVLVAAYNNMQLTTNMRDRMNTLNEFPGDIMWDWGGGYEAIAVVFMDFTWDSQNTMFETPWQQYYQSIRNANALLDNIDNVTSLSPERVSQLKAEAVFIRAADYYFLWELFGPVPLITTASELNFEPVRATREEFDNFLVSELELAANNLPVQQDVWGKATKGAALALLGRYYMNSSQWQKAADTYKRVMDLNAYKLFDGDLANMFAVENEENEEVILTAPALPTLKSNNYMPHAFPPNYPLPANWQNFGTQFCMYNDWVATYHPEDLRLGWFLFEYIDTDGQLQNLWDPLSLGRGIRCFKYQPDPDALATNHGNDVPMIRYAEVLLYRAEALNELQGPNQESVDLLNQVRERAGVPTYAVSDFDSKEEMRDAILGELGWEFVAEGKRRVDLIRHNKLISRAHERGATNAKEHMTVYPIPLNEIKANPNLVQNPGY